MSAANTTAAQASSLARFMESLAGRVSPDGTILRFGVGGVSSAKVGRAARAKGSRGRGLGPTRRQMVLERFRGGMKPREIAKELRCDVRNVVSALRAEGIEVPPSRRG